MKNRLTALFLLLTMAMPFLVQVPAMATIISKPFTFSPGQTLPAASLNGDFDTLYNDYNGSITNANLSASASIALSKLNPTSALFILMASGNNTHASGITGDTTPRVTMTSDGGLKFGNGSTLDLLLKRSSSTTFALRNAGDSADANLTAGTGTFSGALAAPSLTLSTTPLGTVSGGTGLATVGSAGTVLTSNGTTLSYQAAGAGTVTSVAGTTTGGAPFAISGGPVTSTGTLSLDPVITGKGYVISGSGANTMTTLAPGSNGQVLSADSTAGSGLKWITSSGTGTVTSAGFTGDGVVYNSSVTGSPITTTGSFAPSLVSQSGNKFLASPSNGSSAAWAARAIVAADLPLITAAKGGTGVANTPSQGSVLGGTTTGTYTDVTPGTNTGQALVYDSTLGGTDLKFGFVGLRGGGMNKDLNAGIATGNLLVGNSGGTGYTELPVGSNTFVLTADSSQTNGVKWAAPGAGSGTVTSVGQSLTGLPFLAITGSPVTTSGTLALAGSGATGDLPYFSTTNTMAKRTIGSTGDVLTVAGGVPTWAAPTGMTNPLTTTSDTIYSSSGSTPARLAKGTALQYYRMNAGATAPEWGDLLSLEPAAGDIRRLITFQNTSASGTSYTQTGTGATFSFAGGGSSTFNPDADGAWIQGTTTATSGNTYTVSNSQAQGSTNQDPHYFFTIKTTSDITNIAITGGNTVTGEGIFSYDTAAGDTTWHAKITSLGTNIDTLVPVAINTTYKFALIYTGLVPKFYINNVLVATGGSIASGNASVGMSVKTNTTATKAALFGPFQITIR